MSDERRAVGAGVAFRVVPSTPHFAFPFTFGTVTTPTTARTIEQDSDDDLQACIAAILSYPLGSRPELLDFGVPDEAFLQNGPNLNEIRAAITLYEPRADADIDLSDDLLRQAIAKVRVGVHGRNGG